MTASKDLKRKREMKRAQRERSRKQRGGSSSKQTAMPAALAKPDAGASPEIQAAMLQTDRLLRLVEFPIRVDSTVQPEPRVLDNWEIAAPAMLFSAANCLLSIRLLATVAAPRREQDALVLLRRLYEHVVDFAWISIDPAKNAKQWVADDYHYRLKIDDEFKKLGQPGLTAQTRTNYEQYLSTHKRMPDVASRADAADKHWSQHIADHGVFPNTAPVAGQTIAAAQGGKWSLRTLYAVIYRSASAAAHPTPMSLWPYVGPGGAPGRFMVGMDPDDLSDRFGYTHAPLIFSTMLFVSEHVLGIPKRADVEAAFTK